MDTSELREKTVDELQSELTKLKRESFNMRFRLARRDFKNTARVREVRRQTARVLTVLREKKAELAD